MPGTDLVPYAATARDRSRNWTSLEPGELRRRTVEAARDRNLETLWAITEAHLVLHANPSEHTLRAYAYGVRMTVAALEGENVLRPSRDWGLRFVRGLEQSGKASTVRSRLASARALYAMLRWARACEIDPFCDVRVETDKQANDEKRSPYPAEAIEALLEVANARDRVLVLLCAHAGLRVGEACALTPADVRLEAGTLRVEHGKGGKARTVSLSSRLVAALRALEVASGQRLLGLGEEGARAAMRRLCTRAGVTYLGVHSLRHSAGTRLYRETKDLKAVAKHLGHSSTRTADVYVQLADDRLKTVLNDW